MHDFARFFYGSRRFLYGPQRGAGPAAAAGPRGGALSVSVSLSLDLDLLLAGRLLRVAAALGRLPLRSGDKATHSILTADAPHIHTLTLTPKPKLSWALHD